MSATIQHTEQVARRWFPGLRDVAISVVRSATLDDELRQVECRRLEQINVWFKGADTQISMNRAEVEWLRLAFAAALEATDDFAPADETAIETSNLGDA